MKYFLIFLIGCSTSSFDPKPAAEKAALEWFTHLDKGFYQKAFLESSRYLRDRLNRGRAEEMFTQRQMILGKNKVRAKTGDEVLDEYKGLGPGKYFAFYYNSEFERRPRVNEKVLLKEDRGRWRVFDYFFY